MVELIYFLSPFLPLPFLFPSSPPSPLRSGPLNPARRSVDSDVARGLKGGYTKNRTYRRPFTSAIRASLSGNPGASLPQKKN